MKNIGDTRLIDELGRIVLPKTIRKQLNLDAGTPMDIFADGQNITIRKHETECVFCGNKELKGAHIINGKIVCENCYRKIKES